MYPRSNVTVLLYILLCVTLYEAGKFRECIVYIAQGKVRKHSVERTHSSYLIKNLKVLQWKKYLIKV